MFNGLRLTSRGHVLVTAVGATGFWGLFMVAVNVVGGS